MYKKINYTITRMGTENRLIVYSSYYKVIDFLHEILENSVLFDYIISMKKDSQLILSMEFSNKFSFDVYHEYIRDIIDGYIYLEKCCDLEYENTENKIHDKV